MLLLGNKYININQKKIDTKDFHYHNQIQKNKNKISESEEESESKIFELQSSKKKNFNEKYSNREKENLIK